MSILATAIPSAISAVAGAFTKRSERKAAKDTLRAKAVLARGEQETTLAMTDKEWEVLKVAGEKDSWKDEYALVLGTSPFLMIIIGSLATAFGYPMILDGVMIALTHIKDLGVDVGLIVSVSIFTGLGLKVIGK